MLAIVNMLLLLLGFLMRLCKQKPTRAGQAQLALANNRLTEVQEG